MGFLLFFVNASKNPLKGDEKSFKIQNLTTSKPKLKKIESFQHDIVEQQDMVTLFQQRVGKVHKHVAQTKEDISYSAAMKQDLESKIDTYDETIEKKEILSSLFQKDRKKCCIGQKNYLETLIR